MNLSGQRILMDQFNSYRALELRFPPTERVQDKFLLIYLLSVLTTFLVKRQEMCNIPNKNIPKIFLGVVGICSYDPILVIYIGECSFICVNARMKNQCNVRWNEDFFHIETEAF